MSIDRILPVADAPLPRLPEDAPGDVFSSDKTHPSRHMAGKENRYFALLLVMAMFSFLSLFTEARGAFYQLVVYARYALWVFIVFGLVLHLIRAGIRHLADAIALVMPFFCIGIVAGLLGFDPMASARLLVFWILAVIAAAIIGAELRPVNTRKLLLWIFFLVLLLTIALVISVPEFALLKDPRDPSGVAWRGPFAGKNMLGLVCVYAIVVCLCTRSVGWVVRLPMLTAILFCLAFASSQGGVVGAAAAAAFLGFVALLRRTSLSPGAQAAVLSMAMVAGIASIFLLAGPVLQLLGRDPSLTGRTVIWSAFFQRALDFWIVGAGPGSFTAASPITADLGAAFVSLGEIHTPHNMFIAAFGEVGIFGLIAFVVPIAYMAFVLPFRSRLPTAMLTATIAFSMLVGGLIETHEVFGPGLGMFLLILTYSALRREEEEALGEGESPSGPLGPSSDQQAAEPWGPQVLA